MNAMRLTLSILAANFITGAVVYAGYYWHESAKTDTTIWEENMARVMGQQMQQKFMQTTTAEDKIQTDNLLLQIAKERPTWAPSKAFEPEITSAQTELAASR